MKYTYKVRNHINKMKKQLKTMLACIYLNHSLTKFWVFFEAHNAHGWLSTVHMQFTERPSQRG